MELSEILKLAGPHKRRKRIGRGAGSGHGKTSGRGHKGAGSRAGSTSVSMSEGGQMPLFRRVPKRGFSNFLFRTVYHVVNVGQLNDRFEDGAHVTPESLLDAGLIRNLRNKVKVLGDGELKRKLKVEVGAFSKSAAQKIESAGGEAIKA